MKRYRSFYPIAAGMMEMNAQATKLQAAEDDLKELMADLFLQKVT